MFSLFGPKKLTLNCWIADEDISSSFPIKVAARAKVQALKTMIIDANKDLTVNVVLWAVSIPFPLSMSLPKLGQDSQSTAMEELRTVGSYFRTPARDHLHVIVMNPGANNPPKISLSSDTEQDEGQIQRLMIEIFHDNIDLPVWTSTHSSGANRDHIGQLRIPKIAGIPSLLVHRLGEMHDDELDARISKVFRSISNRPIFLCNTSGSGKTRLIFEGFVRHWGIYWTARTSPDIIGSSDLEYAVNELQNKGKLIGLTEENRSTIVPQNKGVASRYLEAVLYARLLVFRSFLEAARVQPEGITEAHKRLWLFIQVDPKFYFGSDLFRTITANVIDDNPPSLTRFMEAEQEKIKKILGSSVAIFTALDEAQVLTNTSHDFFRFEQDPSESQPVLRVLFPLLWTLQPLIVSGTALSMRDVADVYGSVVAKEGPTAVTFTEFGAFETQDHQRAYLEHYLPKTVLTAELASRIGYWLHGRHRFTATYVSQLIENNFESPHRILNAVVFGLSSNTPTDADYLSDTEPDFVLTRPFRGFDIHLLAKDPSVFYQLAGSVFDYVFTGKPRSLIGSGAEKLVELGFSQLKLQTNGEISATTDELLSIMAAAHCVTSSNLSLDTLLWHGLGGPDETSRGPAFEHFCAYLLAVAFKSPTHLDSIFTFAHATDISNQPAQLVVACVTDGNLNTYPIDITSQSRPTYLFGSSASSEIETLMWLQDPAGTVFCFPGHTVGPDIIFLLKLADDTLVLVLAQCRFTGEAFSSIGPSFFISDNGDSKMRHDLQDTVRNLASGTPQIRAIRVLLSRNAEPDINKIEAGVYPCATARCDRMMGTSDNDLREILRPLMSAVADRAVHEKHKQGMKGAHAESKRKVAEQEDPGSSASEASQSTKRKKQT